MVYKKGIHVWIDFNETENASLLILLSFIISGHPDWKKSSIKVFSTCKPEQYAETQHELSDLVKTGRLPITEKNVEIIKIEQGDSLRNIISIRSAKAALVMIGFKVESLKHNGEAVLNGYDSTGTILFVNSHGQKEIF
jgi:hypothetical protein